MDNCLLGIGRECFFQRLNRQVDSSYALLAPRQGEPVSRVLRLKLGSLGKRGNCVVPLLGDSQGLPAQIESMGQMGSGASHIVENGECATHQRISKRRSNGPIMVKYHEKFEVTLDFPEHLLTADSFYLTHGPLLAG